MLLCNNKYSVSDHNKSSRQLTIREEDYEFWLVSVDIWPIAAHNDPKSFQNISSSSPKTFKPLEMKSVYQFVAKNLVTSDLSVSVAGAVESNIMFASIGFLTRHSNSLSTKVSKIF